MADATTKTDPAATDASLGRIVAGIVTRDKMDKTRRVEIQRVVRHAKYGKFVKRRTVCYTHDEGNESKLSDVRCAARRPQLVNSEVKVIPAHPVDRAVQRTGGRQDLE